jgi:hypothetical protein
MQFVLHRERTYVAENPRSIPQTSFHNRLLGDLMHVFSPAQERICVEENPGSIQPPSSVADPDPNPHPDPLVRGMDPRIRIHTKMSWIRNTTALKNFIPNRFLDEF